MMVTTDKIDGQQRTTIKKIVIMFTTSKIDGQQRTTRYSKKYEILNKVQITLPSKDRALFISILIDLLSFGLERVFKHTI